MMLFMVYVYIENWCSKWSLFQSGRFPDALLHHSGLSNVTFYTQSPSTVENDMIKREGITNDYNLGP